MDVRLYSKHFLYAHTPTMLFSSQPESKIEERALCRAVEHKAIKSAIADLQQAHADWSEDLPHLLKVMLSDGEG